MGKGTDKLYITHSEWASGDQFSASAGAGVRAGVENASHASFRRLPYNYCALSLQPFTTPVCTPQGQTFDHENIIRWLLNHDTNPTDGKPLKQSDLVKLNFERNETGNYVDPVTFKEFTPNTHIVAIRHGDSANVFAYDTLERLNFKPKIWNDLVSDEPFTKKDLVVLQDPQNLESRDLSSFQYLRDGTETGVPHAEAEINTRAIGNVSKILKAKEAVAKARAERASAGNNTSSKPSSKTLTKPVSKPVQPTKSSVMKSHHHTTGLAAASLTSTGLTPHTSATLASKTREELLLTPRLIKSPAYIRLLTTLGALTLELQPEFAPKACYNFLQLASTGYYSGLVFHRNIRSFMIQSGDPTGTGRGGASIWGKNFADELDGPMKFDARGVLGMANKGKDANGSQFFITYRKAVHLDRKHTCFGRVVEGLEVLDKMEAAEVNGERPIEDIVIEEATVLKDPFEEFEKAEKIKELGEEEEVRRKKEDDGRTTWTGKKIKADGRMEESEGGGVGKYLRQRLVEQKQLREAEEDEIVEVVEEEGFAEPPRKKVRAGGGFGNFDGW